MAQDVTEANRGTPLILMAPLSGVIVPLTQVPDPVFAEKMVGDGISIDPTNQVLLAPCAGEIIQLHPSHHAVTIKADNGLEILIHIGLDTVTLRGQGFTPQVRVGDRVETGTKLIEFDVDFVASHAKSLLTQIVITNSDQVSRFIPRTGLVEAGKNPVLELVTEGGAIASNIVTTSQTVTSNPIIIPNPAGLHARPSAVLVNIAKKYKSDIKLKKDQQVVNAKSIVSIMGLATVKGDTVYLLASGDDAEVALAELTLAIQHGLGEEVNAPMSAPASMVQSELAAPAPRPRSDDPNLILGVAASSGVAVGYIYPVKSQEITVAETGDAPNQERRKLEGAIAQAKLEIESLRAKVHSEGDPSKAAIFAAHQELLEDPELVDIANSMIDKGKSAGYGWQQAFHSQAKQLAALQNELLSQRANDLRDVGNRVLRILTGAKSEEVSYPANTILIAEDLTPSDMATLDRDKVIGFCTVAGGATSHVAILARSMDIPAIAGTEGRVLDLKAGTPVILDASKGKLRLNPSEIEMEEVRARQKRLAIKRQNDLATAKEPAITTDGYRMEVVANIASVKDAEEAMKLGTEGVGLLRSEFIFMERSSPPSESEQVQLYEKISKILGPDRPLIIRTLDVGGDKPLPYLPIPHEENPFLGERGIRFSFDRPEIMRTQLRAILRSNQLGNIKVMFPMIATLDEWHMAKGMLEEEREKLGLPPMSCGIMVEIPATAIMANQFAQEADFFSIGTNDLTQYTLAMDRGHPKLAPYCDGFNPAIVNLIAMTAKAANDHGKWCGICGGVGSDPQAVPLLIGLGVKELSVSVPTIPSIKAQIRSLSFKECQKLAEKALLAKTAQEVRELSPMPAD